MDLEEANWPVWAQDYRIVNAGGLVDPGYLDGFHRMICGYARNAFATVVTAHKGQPFADQFDDLCLIFIDNPEPNALAIEEYGRRTVAVQLGLLRGLWVIFYRALADGTFLEGYLDGPVPALPDGIPAGLVAPPLYNDPTDAWPEGRADALHDLFARSVEFLICHELAHHARRHLPYVRSKVGMAFIDESVSLFGGTGDNGLFQMLEFDADQHGLDLLVTALDHVRPFGDWSQDQSQTQCFQWAIAIIGLFLLFDLDQAPIAQQYQGSHPPPVHRAMRMASALNKTFGRLFDWSDEDVNDWHDLAWQAVSEIARIFGLPEGRWRGTSTEDMAKDRFRAEEDAYIEFATRFDILP